ncbi:MAG: hypothetical protein JW940_21230 [Polyangiaceae bacterium]|nr:hypothetical protein [Polyangiaceae bacterium]
MTVHTQDVEARLEKLARATDGLRARPELGARILSAVERTARPSWIESVTLSARAGFAVAVFAAAAAVVLAWHNEAQAVEAQAVAYGAMGIEW